MKYVAKIKNEVSIFNTCSELVKFITKNFTENINLEYIEIKAIDKD